MTTQTDNDLQDPNDIVSLREAANRNPQLRAERDTAAAERDAAKRELAFLKAGINPDAPGAHPALAGWVNGYNGDISDVDALRQAAIAASLIPSAPQDPQLAAQAAAEGRVLSASVGASLPSSNEGLVAGMIEARAQGGPEAQEAYMRLHGVPMTENTL